MPNYNFRKDLPIAKATEREVAGYLVTKYDAKIIEFEDTYRYDILTMIKDKTVTFEVKEDFICETTGNVGLEFECRGKPSGIQVSQADYYIYKLHRPNKQILYVMHATNVLKQMVEDKAYFRIVNGGDKGSNSMNYLFKLDVFLKTGQVIRDFTLDKIE